MKVLFGMPLRQTTGFVESLLRLGGLDWKVPNFSPPMSPSEDTERDHPLPCAVLASMISASQAASGAKTVKLSDYAFDFPTYGYEITVSGTTQDFSDKLTADDYLNISDDGYTIKTLIDRMARKDRQQFITFFNEN